MPDLCTATYDRRLLPGETKEGVLRPVLDAIAALEKEDPRFRARAGFASAKEECYTGSRIEGERFFPGWLMDPEAEFVQKVKARLDELGICPRLTEYNFCTTAATMRARRASARWALARRGRTLPYGRRIR